MHSSYRDLPFSTYGLVGLVVVSNELTDLTTALKLGLVMIALLGIVQLAFLLYGMARGKSSGSDPAQMGGARELQSGPR